MYKSHDNFKNFCSSSLFLHLNYKMTNGTSSRGLRGAILTVAVTNFLPFMITHGTKVNFTIESGIEFKFLKALAQSLNFRFKAVQPSDGPFGSIRSDGYWTGMVGMVHRQEVDMGLSYIDITEERMRAVDFSSPYTLSPMQIITKRDSDQLPLRSNIFYRSFTSEVWIIIGLCILTAMIFLRLLGKATGNSRHFRPCWYIFSSLVFRARETDVPRESSIRVFVSFWWVFVIVVMNTFGGKLISSASFGNEGSNIDSLEDLVRRVRRGHFALTQIESTSAIELIQASTTSNHLQYLSNQIAEHPQWLASNATHVIEKLKLGTFATLGFQHTEVSAFLANLTLHFSQETVKLAYQGIALGKNFAYKESINRCISRIFDSGLFEKWKFQTYRDLLGSTFFKRDNSKTNPNFSINIADLKIVFHSLLALHLLTTFVFILEILSSFKRCQMT